MNARAILVEMVEFVQMESINTRADVHQDTVEHGAKQVRLLYELHII